jgi:molybdopterin molybdotransferase
MSRGGKDVLLSVDEALSAVTGRVTSLRAKTVALAETLGLVIAEDVAADLDLPPFDKSLVDGYAIRAGDLTAPGQRFRVVEEIAAGQTPTRSLGPGEAALIMTGAPLPSGADAVVMLENAKREGDEVVFEPTGIPAGRNRLTRGREMRLGEVVIRRGETLNAPRLGLLASVGRARVSAIPRPLVVVVPTGDELVEPDQVPGPGLIRNSNVSVLCALARSAGAVAEARPIAPDSPELLRDALSDALLADVVLVTGGVSAGNRDLVPSTLEALGVERVFHKIRLKPGKPLWFGIGPSREGRPGPLVFGLPGNPVSGVVGFLLFVRPALDILAGRPSRSGILLEGKLTRPFVHTGDRPTYQPSRLLPERGGLSGVEPLDWAGSADLRTVARSDGFALFPAGDRSYETGEIVRFLPLG